MLTSCLFFLAVGKFFISDTGVLGPIPPSFVLIHDQGVILFDNHDQEFVSFDKTGKFLLRFGGKGQGPSELQNTSGVFISNSVVYAFNKKKVVVYGVNGEFVESIRKPKDLAFLYGCEAGWIENQSPLQGLYIWDLTFSNQQFMPLGDNARPKPKLIAPEQSSATSFNPTKQVFKVFVTRDGRVAYVPDYESFTIDIYDLALKRHKKSVIGSFKRLPFNQKWGEEKLENIESQANKGYRKAPGVKPLQFDPDFPKVMPAIRWALTTPEGYLAVRLWSENPWLDQGSLTFYDSLGNEVTSVVYDGQSAQQAVGFLDGQLLVMAMDDDEVAIAKINPKELKDFIKRNPVELPLK